MMYGLHGIPAFHVKINVSIKFLPYKWTLIPDFSSAKIEEDDIEC